MAGWEGGSATAVDSGGRTVIQLLVSLIFTAKIACINTKVGCALTEGNEAGRSSDDLRLKSRSAVTRCTAFNIL